MRPRATQSSTRVLAIGTLAKEVGPRVHDLRKLGYFNLIRNFVSVMIDFCSIEQGHSAGKIIDARLSLAFC